MRILAYIACVIGIIAISIPILMALGILLFIFLVDPLPFLISFSIIAGIIAGIWGAAYLGYTKDGPPMTYDEACGFVKHEENK